MSRVAIPTRAFQWDLGRQVERLDWLLVQLPRYAEWGYQEVYLHLEDAVHYPSLPGVGRKDAYSYRQLGRLVDAATKTGLGVVPIVNLWGHTQYLLKDPKLRDLNELRAPDGSPLERGQICPLHPRMLEVADKLLRDMAPFCTAGKVHVGLDESYHLGKHPLSRAEIAEVGLAGHFARYVGRLHALADARGLRLGLWADMLALVPETISLLPPGIIAYDWYYYGFRRRPRIEARNFAEYDLARPLRARGIEYWGCPMDGAFRHEPLPLFGDRLENIRSWWRRCQAVGAGGMLVTGWEPHRLALDLTVAIDAAAASLWLDRPSGGAAAMLARGFSRVFGSRRTAAQAQARTALDCDRFPFVGYRRWEINARWDLSAERGGAKEARAEERFFRRTAERARSWPSTLSASLAFRRYIAEREVFVRESAAEIFRLRRSLVVGRPVRPRLAELERQADRFGVALEAGRVAARGMWRLSRRPSPAAPNEVILREDAGRLVAWRRWLRRARRDPQLVWEATPVCGAWQFRCIIENFAPALQQIVLEQRRPDGEWKTLHRRFTIEFQAAAARPRASLRRELSVPIDDPFLPLRLAVRGIGQLAVSQVELTDGLAGLLPKRKAARVRKVLGAPPAQAGFPDFDWTRNRAEWPLTFGLPQ